LACGVMVMYLYLRIVKMNDLEICKRIAEIEGEVVSGVGDHSVYIKCQPSLVGNVQYNPLTDDALCFQIMVKHDVDLMSPYRVNGETKWEAQVFSKNYADALSIYDESPNKAILLAIIEAHNEST